MPCMSKYLDSVLAIWQAFFRPEPAKPVMLILRGIAGTFGGVNYPMGALDETSAKKYARRRGYEGIVIEIPGATGPHSKQVEYALDCIKGYQQAVVRGQQAAEVKALYGFSGGGYNVRHILNSLTPAEAVQIKLVVVLGAPNNPANLYRNGPWELVYRTDPPEGHMAGPLMLLSEDSPTGYALSNG